MPLPQDVVSVEQKPLVVFQAVLGDEVFQQLVAAQGRGDETVLYCDFTVRERREDDRELMVRIDIDLEDDV